MYSDLVKGQDRAIIHLLLHCCYRDGVFDAEETDTVAEIITSLQIQKEVNVREEIASYRSYHASIDDESEYLQFLVRMIEPNNTFALFSYCAELCIADSVISPEEATLLERLSSALGLEPTQKSVIERLVIELRTLEQDGKF